MRLVIILFSIFVFLKTLFYGLFEIKNNQNKPGGITVILVGLFSVIFCDVIIYFR